MDHLGIDYETFSDLNLLDVGGSAYSRHKSTEVLMAAYSFNHGPVEQWIPAEGQPIPKILAEALIDPEVEKWAWNAKFEMSITHQKVAEVDVRQWRCTMIQAMHCSLPGKLEKAGPIVGLPADQQKDRRGKALMRKFSIPRKPTKTKPNTRVMWHEDPQGWAEYLEYNRSDVVAEGGIFRRLKPFLMSDDEWELFFLDHKINEAGLPINMNMVRNAIQIYEHAVGIGMARLREITGLENPNSLPQLLPWLKSQGYMFDDCKKGHIKTAKEYFSKPPEHWSQEQFEDYRSNGDLEEALEQRLELSRTSITKYYALERATDADGMLRQVLQMNGAARTGRYAGRIYQPQNLPRPEKRFEDYQAVLADGIEHLDHDALKLIHGNVFDVLASGLRPSAQAPSGMMFVDADLSAIENRVLGWLAHCDKILQVFRENLDPYLSFATYLYDRPYAELWHEYKALKDGSKRTIAKPGTLGCGYGMGAGAEFVNNQTGEVEATGLLGYAWNMGVKQFTQADAKHSVDTFRREFSEVKDYWYSIERAAKKCVRTGNPIRHDLISFEMAGPYLRMILPSKRPLYYLRPKLEEVKTPWGEMKVQLTYEGMNDKKQWVRMHTTPGKLTENADQAISRDLLVHGMKLADKRGIDVRLHVHDQIVGLVLEEKAQEKLAILQECMEDQPKWAVGLPLGSAGLVTKVFVKD